MCLVGLATRRGAASPAEAPSSSLMPVPMFDSADGPALAPGSDEPLRLSTAPYGDDPRTTAAVAPIGPGFEEPQRYSTTPTGPSAIAAVAPVGPGGIEPLRASTTPTTPSTVAPGDLPVTTSILTCSLFLATWSIKMVIVQGGLDG